MIWQEQQIRDAVRRGSSLTTEQKEALINEIDMLRGYLQRIQNQAAGHVVDQEPGWGRWQTTLRLTTEALS